MISQLKGLEFDWFVVDRDGNLALFTTAGQGFVPASVAEYYRFHSAISDSLAVPHYGTSDVWNDYAAFGLFVFDWTLPDGPYKKRASPFRPPDPSLIKKIAALPELPHYPGSFGFVQIVAKWE